MSLVEDCEECGVFIETLRRCNECQKALCEACVNEEGRCDMCEGDYE